ncbi:MAG: hypothetical protein GXO79_07990 [Chlorobi bacterium]|nr:hypothetical protein [Chlorobiota bacterium]
MINKFIKYIVVIFLLNFGLLFAKSHWGSPIDISILNSAKDEFAPIWNKFQNKLYFNSNRSGFSLFYYTEFNVATIFSPPKIVAGELNQKKSNQSYITFEKKDLAYISAFRQFDNRSYLNIFQTRLKKNSWLKAFDIDSLKLPMFMAQPTVSPNGTFLIFSTTLNSEFGDTDLWMAFKQDNGTWGNFIRLEQLKTPGNEITPFLQSDDTLYFASDGQEGPGGYDLFYSIRENGVWQPPYPIEELNTEFNESDFTILPNGLAVFSSDRPGGKGGLDLYFTKKMQDENNLLNMVNVDFSIAAQMPSVMVKAEISEFTYPLVPYYFFNNTSNIFKSQKKNSIDNIKSMIDNSIFIIAKQIKKISDAKLYITAYLNTKNPKQDLINSVRQQIIDNLNLPTDKLILNIVEMPLHYKNLFKNGLSFMKLESNKDFVFNSYKQSKKSISIMPPVLEITLDARPRKLIKSWNSFVTLDGAKTEEKQNGTSLPYTFTYNLLKYKDELFQKDSLLVTIDAKDSLGHHHNYRQSFIVTHTTTEAENLVKYNDKLYKTYDLIVINPSQLIDGNAFLNITREISEQARKSNKIIIHYFSNTKISKIIATKIVDALKNQIGGSKFNVNIEKKNTNTNIRKELIPFYFQVLVKE